MTIEKPDPPAPKVESNELGREIAREEQKLEENTKTLFERSKAFKDFLLHGPEIIEGTYPVEQSVDELIEEINEKFSDRIKNWPLTAGTAYAVVGAAIGNPGGLEGLDIGLGRAYEGAVGAAAVAVALWGVAQLKVALQSYLKNK